MGKLHGFASALFGVHCSDSNKVAGAVFLVLVFNINHSFSSIVKYIFKVKDS